MIIGITGKSESGKSTLAQFITLIRPEYKPKSFKDPLADMMRSIDFAIDTQEQKKQLTWIKATSCHIKANCDMRDGHLTRRGFAQYFATNLIREHIDKDFFLTCALEDDGTNLVFDDVRFPNEVHLIKSLNGIIIRVNRDEKCDGEDVHISERHNLVFDYQVDNVGSEKDLFDWAEIFCNSKLNGLERF